MVDLNKILRWHRVPELPKPREYYLPAHKQPTPPHVIAGNKQHEYWQKLRDIESYRNYQSRYKQLLFEERNNPSSKENKDKFHWDQVRFWSARIRDLNELRNKPIY